VDGQAVHGRILALQTCGLGDCAGLDMGLLQIDNPAATTACFQIAGEDEAKAGVEALALTYPGVKSHRDLLRSGATDVDGKSQFASVNKIISRSLTCDRKVDPSNYSGDEKSGLIPLSASLKIQAAYWRKVGEGKLLQTTVDILTGSSGGPLIDARSGRLLGLAEGFPTATHGAYQECEGATFFVPVAAILKEIRANFPQIDLPSVTSCRQKSF
jgi:hypothetical protein